MAILADVIGQAGRAVKILHVAESIKGGVGTYLNQVIPRQIGTFGSEAVRVIVPAQHKLQIAQVAPENIVEFNRSHRSVGSLISLAQRVAETAREFQPDAIHAHSTFAGAIVRGLYARRRQRPRILYCPHGWVFNVEYGRLARKGLEQAERVLSSFCDAIIAVSRYERDEACRIGIPSEKVFLIPNGIAASPPNPISLPWSDPRLRLLFIGRLDRQKGLDLLCRAVDGLESKVHVRAVGEAVHRARGHPLKVPCNVELLGWRTEPEIQGLLQEADLVAMPSRWEGFGLVAIEAMRAGRPVFASNVGGLPEAIQDGVTGRIFSINNIESLREMLVSTERAALERMGREGRRRFLELFTVDRTHGKLVALYCDLVGRRPFD